MKQVENLTWNQIPVLYRYCTLDTARREGNHEPDRTPVVCVHDGWGWGGGHCNTDASHTTFYTTPRFDFLHTWMIVCLNWIRSLTSWYSVVLRQCSQSVLCFSRLWRRLFCPTMLSRRLYSIGDSWMKYEYGSLVEWYKDRKTEICFSVILSTGMDTEFIIIIIMIIIIVSFMQGSHTHIL